jgi:CRISPR system Cascade subunit CasD
MKAVLIRLEGPLQAWSTQIKLGVRDTDQEPSKSGVLGLVAAALGMARDNEGMLTELRALQLAVRVDRQGSLLHDYHTAGGGRFRGEKYLVYGASESVPSHRYYLQDASFIAALAGEDGLVDRIAAALQTPRWPLFLGRRACVPSVPLFAGLFDGDAQAAIRAAAAPEHYDGPSLRAVVEVPPDTEGEPRYDVPLSFRDGYRRYALRRVRTVWIEVAEPGAEASGSFMAAT